MKDLAKNIGKKLTKSKHTLALAESCTGGLISDTITNISGASKYFKGTVVSYSNDIKISILHVPSEEIKKHGAVSREVARSMAIGAKKYLRADVAAAITGIVGPGGGTKHKPVGLAYIAVSTVKGTYSKKINFDGGREEVKRKFAQSTLKFVDTKIL
jgi:nicotinamide-nucleotide amidase